MEKQEQSRPIFDSEQIDEQIAYLASIQDPQMQKAIPGAQTVSALQYVSAENEAILAQVWTQIALHEAARQTTENTRAIIDRFQASQKKDDMMQETDMMPQLNTTESQSTPARHRSRRLLALVAVLLMTLFVGSFVVLLNRTHVNNSHIGSSSRTTASPSATTQSLLPVPSNQVVQGPSWGAVVYSVGMSNRVDPKTGMVPTEINQFTVGETIELVCSAKPPKDGTLKVVWYSNGSFYRSILTPLLHAKGQQTATVPVVYGLPTEGKVKIYWNNQLAATMLFVVEPKIA